jgi:hypothetical protein
MNRTMKVTALVRTVTTSAALLMLAACAPHQAASPATTPTLAPPPHPSDPTADVDNAYTQFWSVTWTVGTLPPDQWRPRLQQVAADPVLTQLVNGAQAHHDQDISLYGNVIPHVSNVQVSGDQATVTDCQDDSHAGQADAATGAQKTVGVVRTPIRGTLQLGPSNHWRVTRIDYLGGTC